jgi:hypothetical protein
LKNACYANGKLLIKNEKFEEIAKRDETKANQE